MQNLAYPTQNQGQPQKQYAVHDGSAQGARTEVDDVDSRGGGIVYKDDSNTSGKQVSASNLVIISYRPCRHHADDDDDDDDDCCDEDPKHDNHVHGVDTSKQPL